MKNNHSLWSSTLRMRIAYELDEPLYVVMTDAEKKENGYPITEEEMNEFIESADCERNDEEDRGDVLYHMRDRD